MSDDRPPVLRVVSPHATPEEIAALVAVLSALGGADEPVRGPRDEWSAPRRGVRGSPPPSPGPGAWRGSGLPR